MHHKKITETLFISAKYDTIKVSKKSEEEP